MNLYNILAQNTQYVTHRYANHPLNGYTQNPDKMNTVPCDTEQWRRQEQEAHHNLNILGAQLAFCVLHNVQLHAVTEHWNHTLRLVPTPDS